MPIYKRALLTVAKRPAPGQTKTRLTPPLSPSQAVGLYECFLKDTLELMCQTVDVERVIAYLPAGEEDYFRSLAPDFKLILQKGDDLGARLDDALLQHFARGYVYATVMDSDSPTLPASCLNAAFDALADGADVALGPCDDGGYYLIGLSRRAPRLLREVRMSTPNVVADTLALARAEGLHVALLPTWYDVDDATTLARLIAEIGSTSAQVAPYTRAFLDANPDIASLVTP